MSEVTELQVREEILENQEKLAAARYELSTRQGIMKMLNDDNRKLESENPKNLELLLSANVSAQKIARVNCKEASADVKQLRIQETALWAKLDMVRSANTEKEAQVRAESRVAAIKSTYNSPEWTSTVASFNTVAIAHVGPNGALSISIDDPEDDHDVCLTLTVTEEMALRDLLNRRHDQVK